MNQPVHDSPRPTGRGKLILVLLVFVAPFAVAALLTVTGWQPTAKGNGLPIQPQRSFADVRIDLARGGTYAWRDASEPRLTLVALPGPGCSSKCLETLLKMRNARITLNRNSDRLRLLYLGTPPAGDGAREILADYIVGTDVEGKLETFRPTGPDSVAGVFVESNTTALSWYPAGFDPTGLRKDLQKVIK